MTEKPIVYSVSGMSAVRLHESLAYKTLAGGHALHANLYSSSVSGRGPNPPIVIFVHGAVPPAVAIKPTDWGSFDSWGRLVAALGMAGVTFNHRVAWNDGYDETSLQLGAADLSDLVRYLRENGAKLGVDVDRMCIFSFSAGGPLLADSLRESPANVRCYTAFYSFLADPLWSGSSATSRFSPTLALGQASGRVPPIFLSKAALDSPLINESINQFAELARAKGAEVTLVEHPKGRHGFDVLDDDDDSRKIIKSALDFMSRHLRR